MRMRTPGARLTSRGTLCELETKGEVDDTQTQRDSCLTNHFKLGKIAEKYANSRESQNINSFCLYVAVWGS